MHKYTTIGKSLDTFMYSRLFCLLINTGLMRSFFGNKQKSQIEVKGDQSSMSTSLKNQSLVRRAEPIEGESLRGLILRASELNKCEPDSKILYRRAGLQQYNKFNNVLIPEEDLDLQKLSVLLRVSKNDLEQMVLIKQFGESNYSKNMRFQVWYNATCAHKQTKHKNIAIGAVARELVGFVWSIAREAEQRCETA